MKTALKLVLFASFVLVAACGGTNVGQPCTTNNECENGLSCEPLPGGYCTKGCAREGSSQDCPGGSVCVSHSGQLLCANICSNQNECRGEYECNGVTGSSAKACRPK